MTKARIPGMNEESCDQLGTLAATLEAPPLPDERQWGAIQRALAPSPRWRRRLRISLATTMGVALLAVIGSRFTLAYRTEGCAANKQGLISATADHAGSLIFEEGSRFDLAPGTVAEIHPEGFRRGARLRLQDGRTSVSIVHRFAGEWHVLAGPFDVRVTGTAFSVAWNPEDTRFHVKVTNGTVRVSGGPLNGATPVGAGQSLNILANTREITWNQAAPNQATPKVASPAPPLHVPPPKTDTVTGEALAAPRPRKRRLVASRLTAPKDPDTPVSLDPAPRPFPLPAPGEPGYPLDMNPSAELSPSRSNNPSGTLFVAIGRRTKFLPPAEGQPTHVYKQNNQRCTNVHIAALSCAGSSPSHGYPCDWKTNWGALFGWFPRSARRPWGEASAKQLSFDFKGTPGHYRLVAHVHGDPPSRVYCVDGYTSGKVVIPSDFQTECWINRGPTLPDFESVDFISIHRPSTHSPQSVQICLKAVNLN